MQIELANFLASKNRWKIICKMIWKAVRLILLENQKKVPNASTSHRPICLLDILEKLLETFIRNHLHQELEEKHTLPEHQYGFRTGRSILDTIQKILEIENMFHSILWKNHPVITLSEGNNS